MGYFCGSDVGSAGWLEGTAGFSCCSDFPKTSLIASALSLLSSSVRSLSRSMNSRKYFPPAIGILILPT